MIRNLMGNMIFLRFLVFMIGASICSFINCTISRELRGERWIDKSSYCELCGHKLHWYEIIPVFSCLITGGRCTHCGRHYGMYHAFTETIMGFLYLKVYSLDYSFSTVAIYGAFLFFGYTLCVYIVLVKPKRFEQYVEYIEMQRNNYLARRHVKSRKR